MNLTKKYLKNCLDFTDIIPFLILRYARTRPLNGNALLTRILRKLYPLLKLKSKTFNGLTLVVNPADLSHLKITDEFFFDRIYKIDNLPFTPDCIIDCGAHIGMFSLLCSGLFKKAPIHIFEPNPKNLVYIRHQIRENNLVNTRINEVAVSNYNGTVNFHNSEVSFGGYISNDKNTVNSYTVSVINLIEYLKSLKTERLLIKVDIEGEEEKLFPDLIPTLPYCCTIYFEYHFGTEKFNNMVILLEANGFTVKINRIVDDLYTDAIAYRNN